MIRFFAFFLLLASLLSCEIIQAPYLDNPELADLPLDEQCAKEVDDTQGQFNPDPAQVVKRVLFEEMTGHKCGNCPEATEVLYDLKTGKYANRLVTVTIHAGPLAGINSNGKYTTEFRTADGNKFYNDLNQFDAVPFGLIDRADFGLGAATWDGKIGQRLQETPELGIRINNCYLPDSLLLTTVIDMKFFADLTDEERLSVWLIEDNVKDWQKDYRLSDEDIPDYTHHDVFRASLNGTYGENISDITIRADDRIRRVYSFRLKPEYDAANCKVVAFLHNWDSKEVRQVMEAPVVN